MPPPALRPIVRARPTVAAGPVPVGRQARAPRRITATAHGAKRAARFATEDFGFRVVLATLLAIGAMFGAWAVDLTLKDVMLVPAANPAAEQRVVTTATPAPTGDVAASRLYVVRPGDTLRAVAARVYGDDALWQVIYDANRDRVDDPQNLSIGTRLRIPDR